MKISILLPFKENFSPSYAGAVSLFVNDTLRISKYRKSTTGSISKSIRKEYLQVHIRFEVHSEKCRSVGLHLKCV